MPFLTLHVTVHIAPSNIIAFKAALRPCFEGCVAEPECLFFDIYQSQSSSESGLVQFRFVEVWDFKNKQEFVEKQMTKGYYEPFFKVAGPMGMDDRMVEFFETDGEDWTYVSPTYGAVLQK